MTGVCVKSTNTCEVLAWCPVENDHTIPEYVETEFFRLQLEKHAVKKKHVI